MEGGGWRVEGGGHAGQACMTYDAVCSNPFIVKFPWVSTRLKTS